MITLQNVSIKTLRCNQKLIKKLISRGIFSVQDAIEALKFYTLEEQTGLINAIEDLKKELKNSNERNRNPEIYQCKQYTDQELQIQDYLNFGSVLIIDNPVFDNSDQYYLLKKKTIEEIESDLGYTYVNGKNFVVCNHTEYEGINKEKVKNIITAINMYKEQIERQAKLTPSRLINLFLMDEEEKKKIVTKYYAQIINYLLENTRERFVWAKINDYQRVLYEQSLEKQTKKYERLKNTIIRYITDYTTLEELEAIKKDDLNVLQRFIVK